MASENKNESMLDLLKPKNVAKELRLGRSKTYELMGRKDFPSFRLGRNLYVSRENLRRWIQMQSTTCVK